MQSVRLFQTDETMQTLQALQRDGTDGRPPLLFSSAPHQSSNEPHLAPGHHGSKKESFQGHAAWRRRADALAFTAGHFQICQIGARGSRNDVVRSVMAPGAEISAGLASAASPLPPMGSRLHCGFTGDFSHPHLLRKFALPKPHSCLTRNRPESSGAPT
jgi:hypothetical protein